MESGRADVCAPSRPQPKANDGDSQMANNQFTFKSGGGKDLGFLLV